jgi:hypothetical protein
VVLVLGLLGWGGYLLIKDIVGRAERAEEVMAEVRERYGDVSEFQPSASGTLPPERVEAFLRARELMADERAAAEASLSVLSSEGAGEAERVPGFMGWLLQWGLGVARVEGVTSLLPRVIGFVAARNEALLETGMGPGEYLYVYSIVYYSWLGRSPADGPAITLVGDDHGDGQGQRTGQDEFDVREKRRELVLTRVNETLLPMLRRQLEGVDKNPGADPRWSEQLAAEVEAMESDPFRIPWRDGVPEPIGESLEPYRRELESSYSPLCNPLEVVPGSES